MFLEVKTNTLVNFFFLFVFPVFLPLLPFIVLDLVYVVLSCYDTEYSSLFFFIC